MQWVIQLKETKEVIGVISAEKSYKYKCLELGYSISSNFFNQGLMTEGLKSIVEYIFSIDDISVVEAIIPSLNIASIKVAKKVGLSLEAKLKNRYKDKENNVQDLLIYSKFKN